MKRPSKKQVDFLRIAIGMTGAMSINDAAAELILVTQSEMKRLGGKFSLRDAAAVHAFVDESYKPKEAKS